MIPARVSGQAEDGCGESAPPPTASNGISMNLRAAGSRRADRPAIRAAVPLHPNATLPHPVCYYRLTCRGRVGGGVDANGLKGGGGEGAFESRGCTDSDPCTLTFGCSSSVRFGRGGATADGELLDSVVKPVADHRAATTSNFQNRQAEIGCYDRGCPSAHKDQGGVTGTVLKFVGVFGGGGGFQVKLQRCN